MARIFYVHCPNCRGKFPCHSELWDSGYDLLCPFCRTTFPQEASPLIITMTGEQRPGTLREPSGGLGLHAPGAQPPHRAAPADTTTEPTM